MPNSWDPILPSLLLEQTSVLCLKQEKRRFLLFQASPGHILQVEHNFSNVKEPPWVFHFNTFSIFPHCMLHPSLSIIPDAHRLGVYLYARLIQKLSIFNSDSSRISWIPILLRSSIIWVCKWALNVWKFVLRCSSNVAFILFLTCLCSHPTKALRDC